MRPNFPSKDILMAMPIQRIRLIDIKEKDEEELVQEVLSARLSAMAPTIEIKFNIPDIKTVEEERMWQQRIDEAKAQQREVVARQGLIAGATLDQIVAPPEPVSPEPEVKVDTPPIVTPTEEVIEKPKRRGRKPKVK